MEECGIEVQCDNIWMDSMIFTGQKWHLQQRNLRKMTYIVSLELTWIYITYNQPPLPHDEHGTRFATPMSERHLESKSINLSNKI